MRKPALIALIPFCLGIVGAYYVDAPLHLVFALLTICFLASTAVAAIGKPPTSSSWKGAHQLPFWAMLALAGAFRYELATTAFPANHVSGLPIYDRHIRLDGTVHSEPEPPHNSRIRALLEVQTVELDGQQRPISGKILLIIRSPDAGFDFGDRVSVHGQLRKPSPARNPGGFDYGSYLVRGGVFGWMSVPPEAVTLLEKGASRGPGGWVILPIRRSMRHSVERNLSGVSAAFLKNVLFGGRSGMPEEVTDALSRTGLIHVTSVSGLHVGIVTAIFFFAFRLLGLSGKWTVAATLLAVGLYACVAGLRPSAVRAAIMASVVLIGIVIERNTNVINSLSLAGLLILAVWPQSLLDLSFQLSFAAVLSIALLYGPIGRVFPSTVRRPDRWWDKATFGVFSISLAAQLGTAPIVAYHFNNAPVIGILANILVVPAVSLAVVLGLLTCAFGPWLAPVAAAFNAVNSVWISGLMRLVRWFSDLPYASVRTSTPSVWLLLAYFPLLWLAAKAVDSLRYRKLLVFSILLVANLWVWKGPFFHRDELEVTFLDVGEGDATFVSFPNGRKMLVDGGDRRGTFDAGEQIIEPFLRSKGIGHLDVVLATHGDSDHIGGLVTVLQRFQVRHLLDNGHRTASRLDQEMYEWADKKGVAQHRLSAGDSLLGLGEVHAVVLHPTESFARELGEGPEDSNDASVVLKLRYRGIDLLLTGDIEETAEQALLRWGGQLDAEVLKVPHHGSDTSSSERFLDAARPRWGVISARPSDRLSHPSPEVLARYARRGVPLLRTDQHGAVVLTVSDRGVRMESVLGPCLRERRP